MPAPQASTPVPPSWRQRLLDDGRVRFLIAGGFAAGLAWTLRFGFSLFLPYWAAVALATAVSLVAGFGIYRSFVFRSNGGHLGRTISAFLLVNGVGAGLTVLVAVLAARGIAALGLPAGPAEAVGHGIGIAVAAVFNFLAHKHWTFKGSA